LIQAGVDKCPRRLFNCRLISNGRKCRNRFADRNVMNAVSKTSMLLNLILLGSLIFVLEERRNAGNAPMPVTVIKAIPQASNVAASQPIIQTVEETKPFEWSQLESSDYRTYIKNLRAIGCPEPTLRAIVTADVDKLYSKRSQELEQKLDALENDSWSTQISSFDAQQTLKAELQKLPTEELDEIADLLGLKFALEQVANALPASPISRNRRRLQDNRIVLPLVFQNVDLSALNLNSQQIQVITDLRQSFFDEIGGPNQDPNDPAYRKRWQKAQPDIDNMLRGDLGISAFQNYQLAAQNP